MQTHAEVFQVAIEDRQTVFVLRMGRRAGGEYREEVGARGCRRGVFADDLPHPGGDFHADLDSGLAAVIDQLLAPDIVARQIRHIDKGHPAGQEAERRQVHCQLLLGAQDGGGERGHPLHQGGGDGTLGRRLAAELQVQERVSAERDAPIVAGRMIYGTQTTQITVDCIYFQSLGLEETTEVGDLCGRQVRQAATATSQEATEVDRRAR